MKVAVYSVKHYERPFLDEANVAPRWKRYTGGASNQPAALPRRSISPTPGDSQKRSNP